jgi:6-phospho-beta-glucosidase
MTRGEMLLAQQSRFFSQRSESPVHALTAWRAARRQRYSTYLAEGWAAVGDDHAAQNHGDSPATASAQCEEADEEGYALVASAFLRAVRHDNPQTVVLDVPNRGHLPFLSDDAIVELPCAVSSSGVSSLPATELSPAQQELVVRVKNSEQLTIRASLECSASLALEALASHPIVPSRSIAELILSQYVERHPVLRANLR